MLILARKVGESIVIDGRIVVTIVGVKGNPRARSGEIVLGITAPDEVKVWRQELLALEAAKPKGLGVTYYPVKDVKEPSHALIDPFTGKPLNSP